MGKRNFFLVNIKNKLLNTHPSACFCLSFLADMTRESLVLSSNVMCFSPHRTVRLCHQDKYGLTSYNHTLTMTAHTAGLHRIDIFHTAFISISQPVCVSSVKTTIKESEREGLTVEGSSCFTQSDDSCLSCLIPTILLADAK